MRSLQARRDWKIPMPLGDLPSVLHGLATTHAIVLSEGAPIAEYHTDYYDTADLRCFHDHRRGRPVRFKVRYRDYIERRSTRLEVKVRQARGDTTKHFVERPFKQHVLEGADLEFVEAHVPFQVGPMFPSMSVTFSRITLVGLRRDERITIDHGLTWNRNGTATALSNVGVIELKSSSRRMASTTLHLLSALGHRPSRLSKYCAGIALSDPHVRSNRLHSTLRRLARIGAL